VEHCIPILSWLLFCETVGDSVLASSSNNSNAVDFTSRPAPRTASVDDGAESTSVSHHNWSNYSPTAESLTPPSKWRWRLPISYHMIAKYFHLKKLYVLQHLSITFRHELKTSSELHRAFARLVWPCKVPLQCFHDSVTMIKYILNNNSNNNYFHSYELTYLISLIKVTVFSLLSSCFAFSLYVSIYICEYLTMNTNDHQHDGFLGM